MHAGVTVRLLPAGGPEGAAAGAPGAVSFLARPGEGLASAIWLSGAVAPRPLCLGLGRCGRCRVRYVHEAPPPMAEDEAVLPPQEVAAGWRLACRRTVPDRAPGDVLELEVPPEALVPPDTAEAPAGAGASALADEGDAAVLGVDLGTTSLQWRAVAVGGEGAAAAPGRVLAEGSELNPQAGAGADVMSRLAFARSEAGLASLGGLARGAVAGIVGGLARAGMTPRRVCVAANTAMTDIFLGKSVEGLCAAPYRRGHPGAFVAEVPGLPPVVIPPLPAPFVGGDVSAGLAALLVAETPRPFVLADLGTNGELALLTEDERLFLASVPLGPALEGIGPERGAMAGPGVVTEFRLGPQGPQPVLFAKEPGAAAPAEATGISATGYLSLLAQLFRLGVLDQDGHFVAPDAPGLPQALPLARALAGAVTPAPGGARLPLPLGLWLSAADVELLLKVKAAFAVALEAVCAAAGVAPARLQRLALAGALGEHVRLADLKDLGFAPGVPLGRMVAVGNTALAGACLLAACPERLAALAALCERAAVLELTEGPGFQQAYLAHMRLGE